MRTSESRARPRRIVLVVVLLSVAALWFSPAAGAEDLGREDPDGAQELAEKFAPVMALKAQEAACDPDGEPYAPTSVEIVLDNPEILLRQVGTANPVVMRAPGAADLFGLGEGMFLDFPGSALEPACIYEKDFDRFSDGLPVVVYAHVAQQEDHPDLLAVQYWFYWYYNDWNNKHESDWEFISLLFEASSIDDALATEPISVGYAQHEGGERADWDSSKLERAGSHPVVYSSAGSHASYFGSALYLGRSGSEGFGCDNTDGPTNRFDPAVVVLPDRVDDPADELAWLAYEGRWGERQNGPFNGPTGPTAKDRWLNPVDWHDELRSSSVVVPGGDAGGLGVISVFCDAVEWGSGTLIQATTSPLRLGISALLIILVARWLVRRTDWSRVAGTPLRRRRRAGQIIRTAASAYGSAPVALLTFGLVYVPTAFVAGLVAGLFGVTPFVGDLLDLAGGNEGVSVLVALLAGSFATLAAYVAVNAMVSVYTDEIGSDSARSPVDVAKLTWERNGDVASGLVRAFAIVFVLLVSVVGIPWGIRQLVRYQLFPQCVMLEGLGGKEGLARSSELVEGRWWHTGVMIALFNALLVAAATVFGLLLLVAVTGLPLWLFSMLTTLIYALLTPLTAVAQTLLYGDAVAENQEQEAPEPVFA
jgi:hypothetical protein